ncbi:hypothetical protein BD310DRAFT_923634 [Dichomitus squalens]|uniref:Uncharacterized protein n=1 Tax=Dichomitus squalens TaxID=114155 RepID=A0A4Q9Q096_9APHY|nr:hypothetical protein BD310DRAFT_923634 [Dichomitus squalens]
MRVMGEATPNLVRALSNMRPESIPIATTITGSVDSSEDTPSEADPSIPALDARISGEADTAPMDASITSQPVWESLQRAAQFLVGSRG